MTSPLEEYEKFQALVRKDAEDAARKVYTEMATKYGVAKTPLHKHNGADSPFLGPESLTSYIPLSAVAGKATIPLTKASSGVVSPTVLGLQIAQNSIQASNPKQANTTNSKQIYVDPIPVIFGFGNPGDPNAEFHGGNAPVGTMILFVNPTDGIKLFVRVDREGFPEGWWGTYLTETES